MATIRPSRAADAPRILEIWRDAVDATHHFLTTADRQEIDELVQAHLIHAPMEVAVDDEDRPLAFMLIEDAHMEALFVDPNSCGRGLGALLVRHGLVANPAMTTDVNEQNDQAVGFYKRMGFERAGRSACDGQGRAYPLIHLAFTQQR